MPQLTFTRFIACMLVVLYHESNEAIFTDYEKFRSIIKYGDASVSYFFLLSGFILSLNQIQTNNRFNIDSIKTFWLKRFARIYPVYFLAFITCIIQFYFNNSIIEKLSTGLILSNITLTQSWFPDYTLNINYPSWSLSVEAFFYLCFPFIFNYLFSLRTKFFEYLILALLGIQGIITTIFIYIDYNYYYSPLLHISTFISGIWLSFIYIKYENIFKKYSIYISTFTFLYLINIIGAFFYGNLFLSKYYNLGILIPLHMLIILSVINSRFLSKVFTSKPLQYLGEISYSIYILHVPTSILIYSFAKEISGDTIAAFSLYILFLILFSSCCYRMVEVPARRIIIAFYNYT